MIPKILIVPPMKGWYMEAHAEYLIRYLSDEFFIEVADVPYPPYENFLNRFPETSPFQRSPDDYDLIFVMLPSHWVITEAEKYKHKVCEVWYQPGEGSWEEIAAYGVATPLAEQSLQGRKKFHSLRFGIDTDLFKPIPMIREDDLLHVGMIGTLFNPRRIVPEVTKVLKDVEGIRLMYFPVGAPRDKKELDAMGGNLDYIVAGDKYWPGIPNLYNRLDILLRVDHDPGYSFPTLEAAACGVPVIATDSGIDHLVCEAGGGILLQGNRASYLEDLDGLANRIKEHVIYFRDNPEIRKKAGQRGRKFIENNFTWDKFILAWREFFREGVKNANRSSRQ